MWYFDADCPVQLPAASASSTRTAGGDPGLSWLQADAEAMPCASESLDSYTIAFGIRNVTDVPAALREAYRVRPTQQTAAVELK